MRGHKLKWLRRLFSSFLLGALTFSILAFALHSSQDVFAQSIDEWPMFRHDLQHTGYSNSTRAHANLKQWNYTTGDVVPSSPAVVGGRLYVGSYDNQTYCLNASTGDLIWRFATGGQIWSSPAVVAGRVYIGSFDNRTYCLDASTGGLIWNYTTGDAIWSSPAVVGDRLYVGSFDNVTYCLNASTGTEIWSYNAGSPVVSSPAVAYGCVYIGTEHYSFYCLDASTGLKVWNCTTDGSILSSPTVADGRVYVGSMRHTYGNPASVFYCLNASTGDQLWNYVTGDNIESSPAVAYGNVYVGSEDDNVYCLNASTGTLTWNFTTGGGIDSSPVVAEGEVYIGSSDNKIYCLDAENGTQVWNYTTNGPITSSLAIVNSKIYFGSNDGNVYCLGSNQYVLKVRITGQGTTNATGLNWPDSGSQVSVLATPSNGWSLSYWLLDGSNVGSANPYAITVDTDNFLTAVFSSIPPEYVLLVGISGSGTTNATGSRAYDAGSNISVQAVPSNNWMLSYWLLNGSNAGSANPYTTTINADVNLTAMFTSIEAHALRDPGGAVASMQIVRVTANASEIGSNVKNATLSFTTDGGTSWLTQSMIYNVTSNLYEGIIPGKQTGTQVQFKITVYYDAGNSLVLESNYSVGSEVWAPSTQGAAVAVTVTVSAAVAVSALASAAGSTASQGGSKIGEKLSSLLPSTIKKWLGDSVSSRSKLEVKERVGSRFILTKAEVVSYAVTVLILTLAFAYAKASSLNDILSSIPLILATSIFVDLVKTYTIAAICRHFGVWTEHRLWYLGMSLFAFSTLAFKVPFSTPSRLAHHSPKMTKRIGGILGSISILLSFVFAFVFLVLFISGYTLIGNIGVIMCLTGVFFDIIPIAPMGGKGIYDWNKIVWLALFLASISAYIIVILVF